MDDRVSWLLCRQHPESAHCPLRQMKAVHASMPSFWPSAPEISRKAEKSSPRRVQYIVNTVSNSLLLAPLQLFSGLMLKSRVSGTCSSPRKSRSIWSSSHEGARAALLQHYLDGEEAPAVAEPALLIGGAFLKLTAIRRCLAPPPSFLAVKTFPRCCLACADSNF